MSASRHVSEAVQFVPSLQGDTVKVTQQSVLGLLAI
jgi:hypothetical protein